MNKKKPTIYVFNHDASMYGAQKSLLDILRLSKNTFDYVVFNPSNGPLVLKIQSEDIDCFEQMTMRWVFGPNHIKLKELVKHPKAIKRYVNSNPYLLGLRSLIFLPFRIYKVYKLAQKHRPKLIYTNTLTNIDGAMLALILKVPHVWHVRERLSGNRDLCGLIPESFVAKYILKLSTNVITNSYSLKNKLFNGINSSKLEVIHNGVDISLFKLKPEPINEKNKNFHKVAICGSIIARKDVKTFIKAATVICEQRNDVQFYIIGDTSGEYYQSILSEIQNQKVFAYINFLGHKERIFEVFDEMDTVVSTAIYEPFGKTIIEAMASQLPVIATKSGGPEEIVIDGETGFLVDIGDYEVIARKVMWLVDNPIEAKKMGELARKRVEEKFELSHSVNKVVSCLKEAMSNN